MPISDPGHLHFWQLLTRLGEMQITLPAAFLAALMLVRCPDGRPLAAWWMGLLGLAALATTASKIAFIGWGLGWPELDFTGFSGHAMFAAAIYPLLFGTLASCLSTTGQRLAVTAGFALAFLIGLSRLMVDAHSISEVMAGLLLGGGASATAMALAPFARVHMPRSIAIAVVAWLTLMPLGASPSWSHSTVTQLSLTLTGHKTPYSRADLRPNLRQN